MADRITMEIEQLCDIVEVVEVERQIADFHPTVRGDYFIKNPPMPSPKLASLRIRNDELKVQVLKILEDTADALQSLELIDKIQRLGVAYHFEKEINEKLHIIHNTCFDYNDLYAVGLHFRILRQQRYYISCDVFERFLDEKREFMASLSNNVKDLLSLYEASHLCMPGEEDILDKAKTFTKSILSTFAFSLEPYFEMMISSSLDVPLIRRVDRPRTKLYLAIYEKDITFNKVLLDFAKLDFLILQALYQEELRNLSIWWLNVGLNKILSFVRDRIVELFFWTLSVYHEPCYSRARTMMVKMLAIISITDDIYDTYGTLEELNLLTDVIKRWEIGSVSKLPNYLQLFFRTIHQTFKEFEEELEPEQYSFRVKYIIEGLKRMAEGYNVEAKWASEYYVPTLKDHLKISIVTAGYFYSICASLIGMEDVITEDFFEWLSSMPPIMISTNLIARFLNDIMSYEFEQSRKHVASTVQCYMMEQRCSKEEACTKIMEMAEEQWNILNREFIFSKIHMALILRIINITKALEVFYNGDDHYTKSNKVMKDHITSILVEPIQVDLKVEDNSKINPSV